MPFFTITTDQIQYRYTVSLLILLSCSSYVPATALFINDVTVSHHHLRHCSFTGCPTVSQLGLWAQSLTHWRCHRANNNTVGRKGGEQHNHRRRRRQGPSTESMNEKRSVSCARCSMRNTSETVANLPLLVTFPVVSLWYGGCASLIEHNRHVTSKSLIKQISFILLSCLFANMQMYRHSLSN